MWGKESKFELVPYPSIPLEQVYADHGLFRGVTSRHTRDLIAIIFIIVGAASFISLVAFADKDGKSIHLTSAIVSSALAAFGAIYQLAKKRFSTVDVFSSEILARMRILAADNSIDEILRFSDVAHVRAFHERSKEIHRDKYVVIEPSKESPFEIFYRRSDDLGGLSPVVVDHATDFYNFHMAARDQLRELMSVIENFPEDFEEIKLQVVDVIFMLDLMAYSAFRVLDELIEKAPHKWHSWQVVLCVATRASAFLIEFMNKSDPRYSEVICRNATYAKLIGDLKKNLSTKYAGRRLVPKGQCFF